MAKKFNIHNWQSKHIFEQDDFTPDLEDDDLKRSKVQQMMRKEKMLAKDKGPMVDSSTMNLISNIDQTWESYEIMTDDLIQFLQAQHDANGSDIVDDWDDLIDTLQKELEYFREDEELDENMTSTGASFSAGNSMAHMGKSKKKRANTPSGDMAYTQNINEQEEVNPDFLGSDGQIEPDVEKIGAMIGTKINTGEEWIELFHMLMAQSSDINQLTSTEIKQLLINYSKEI